MGSRILARSTLEVLLVGALALTCSTAAADESCDGEVVTVTLYDSWGDGNTGTGDIRAEGGILVITLGPITGTEASFSPTCLAHGTYTLKYQSDNYANEFSFSVASADGSLIVDHGGTGYSGGAGVAILEVFEVSPPLPGCMDENASNYDETANVADDSCEPRLIPM